MNMNVCERKTLGKQVIDVKYGGFSQDGSEFVITRPDTPTPWINYLSNSQYCAMVSNTGGGYSFHVDPKDRRILRYRYNNLPVDRPGRYFYIRDAQSGQYWSPTWQPVLKPLDQYECRHGLGYTRITSIFLDLKAEVTYFVPLKDNLEIWQLTLENLASKKREFNIFSYAEFCLWRALSDQNDLQYIQNVAMCYFEQGAIFYSLFDQVPGFAFFSSNREISSYDCDREEFIGPYRSEANPLSVEKGACSNSRALGGNPIAATCTTIELSPKEKKTIVFFLGVVKEKSEASILIKKYSDPRTTTSELGLLRDSWQRHLETFFAETPDKDFNNMVNVWNPYQCKVTFDWSRYVSLYETGIGRGMGFRDSNQDTMGINYALPIAVRQRLLDLTKNQFESGKVYHIYFPLTGKGDFPDYAKKDQLFFSDDHLWLILAVWDYIKETGDLSILDEKVNFVEGSTATLYNHLKRAVDFTLSNLGKHSLPLMGSADWNDTLHLPGPNNSAQSIWVAMQFHKALLDLVELSKEYRQDNDAKLYLKLAEQMKTNVNGIAWDGQWYIRAYDDNGDPVGSSKCQEGKIYLNTQTWAVLSKIAPHDRAIQCLKSVNQYLNTDYGVMLLTPPYTHFSPQLGGISTFPPGLKENGSIFCHSNPWLMIAECMLGRGDLAYSYYTQLSPPRKTMMQDVHRTEPYVYSQMITGKHHPRFGQAKNSWLTGTAAWSMKSASQWILGIRPEFRGLLVDPCIPKEWSKIRIIRHFRNTLYEITIDNPDHVSKGVKEVKIDGKRESSNLIPVLPSRRKTNVQIIMGE